MCTDVYKDCNINPGRDCELVRFVRPESAGHRPA